jgi:hypothetical protein
MVVVKEPDDRDHPDDLLRGREVQPTWLNVVRGGHMGGPSGPALLHSMLSMIYETAIFDKMHL